MAAFEDYPVMGYAIKSASLPLRLTDYLEEANQYGFAVSKGKNAELLADFNAGLAKLKANGRYDEIINKYIS
ncbi:transporter substrate-binding domain-containing protein, partial [Streptomyces sp. P17]